MWPRRCFELPTLIIGSKRGAWINARENYPCIIYGSTPELINPAVQSTQVANFASLSTSYSITISGDQSGFDTIFDMWLTSQPNGAKSKYELEIVAHQNGIPCLGKSLHPERLNTAECHRVCGAWLH